MNLRLRTALPMCLAAAGILAAPVPVFGPAAMPARAGERQEGGAGPVIAVPSGQPVTWLETLSEPPGPDGSVVRFRFLAPAIDRATGHVGFEQAAEDMQHLCDTFALPRIAAADPPPDRIIISLASRPVAFGVTNSEVTRYFEAYRPGKGSCHWEGF